MLSIFLFIQLCQSCTTSVSNSIPDITIISTIVDEALHLSIEGPSDAWFAIALSQNAFMPNSLAFVSSKDGLSLRDLVEYKEPNEITNDQITLSKTTSGFKAIVPLDQYNFPNSENETFFFLVAKGSSKEFSYHTSTGQILGCSIQSIREQIDIAISVTVDRPIETWETAHFALLGTAWLLLAPIAIFASILRDSIGESWFLIHFYTNSVAIFLAFVGIVIAIMNVEEHFLHFHTKFGVAIASVVLFHGILALARPGHDGSTWRTIWEHLHRATGIFLLVASMVNVLEGIELFKRDNIDYTKTIVIIWQSVIIIVAAAAWFLKTMGWIGQH